MSVLRVNRRALTLTEILLVMIIMGILITLAVVSAGVIKAQEDEKNARRILSALQKAAWDYSVRTESCTEDLEVLEIGDPNKISPLYTYRISCSPDFSAKACKKKDPDSCITIDKYGEFSL
ncbi:MAG: type II secretion system protein [Candidatus Omnitrophota bacterium]|jgi:prepilin-type N-terminal cleavage/methylation domain-containing protein